MLQWSSSQDPEERRGGAASHAAPGGPVLAWNPSVHENTSETESIESRESVKSRDTSPSHSPLVTIKTFPNYNNSEVRQSRPQRSTDNYYSVQEPDAETEDRVAGISKRHMSKAANSHKFNKIQKPSKCRECDKYVYWQGYECESYGPANHKK